MSILPLEPVPSFSGDTVQIVRNDRLNHHIGTEAHNPDIAEDAWRVHAEGYVAMGFVSPNAMTPEGYLPEDMDKARGPYVDYYIGRDDAGVTKATMRKEFVPYGEDYTSLPAYALSGESLSYEGAQRLYDAHVAGARILEIGALARTPDSNPMAVHEVIRNGIHQGLGQKEIWFFTIVSTTYDALDATFGKGNFEVLGGDVAIPDDRVNPELRLRPATLNVDEFFDRMLNAYNNAAIDGDQVSQRRLERNLLFYTDGLRPDQMGENVHQAVSYFKQKQAARAASE